jgi:hypothetical protein
VHVEGVLIHGLFFCSNETQEDRQFTRGREVLGLFIGIVGTIVGFYFGSAEKAATKIDLAILPPQVDAATNKIGIQAHTTGGTPPYVFVVSVGSQKLKDSPFKSDDGWLSISLGKSLEGSEITVEVTDAKNVHASKKAVVKGSPPKETTDKNTPTKDPTTSPKK